MKEIKSKKLLFIFTLVVFLIISIVLVNKNMQNDTFYTIKVGEVIEKYGVDMKDHFSFIPNLKYTYPHWLYDLGIYKIYNSFGFDGLFISNMVLTFILCISMFITSNKIVKNYGIAFITTIFTSAYLNPFITVRAQLVSYILLLLILYSIEMLREKGKYRYLVYICLLSILLANIHAAVYPVIFLLFLPYLVSDFLSKFFKASKESILVVDKPKNTKLLIIGFLLCILCGFFSLTNSTYTYILYIMMGRSTSVIQEHAPASLSNNPFIFIFIGIFILILLTKKIKIKLSDLFMIGGLFLLAFLSLRSFSLFLILSLYSFTRLYTSIEKNYLKHITITSVFKMPIVMIFTIIIVSISGLINFSAELKEDYISEEDYPVQMVEYIKENMDYKNMRIYHEYDIGSYLLYNDIKVFIDSRSDLYMKEFNKGCNAFNDALGMPYNYREVLDKYDFTHILIFNKDGLNKIVELLPEYELIKKDNYFSLYEKRV